MDKERLKPLSKMPRLALYLTGLISLASLSYCFGQSTPKFEAYILKPGLSQMTKAEFINADSLSTTLHEQGYLNYTIVATGGKQLIFDNVTGNRIPDAFKEYVKNNDNCVVTVDNIMFISNKGRSRAEPFVIKIK